MQVDNTTTRCNSTDVLPSLAAAADNRQRLAELADEIAELSAQIDAATSRLLRAIAEFDRRGGWHDGFASCAHWLSYRVGLSLVTAREKVRVARALDGLPRLGEALATGRISYSKVRELTRIARPENEAELVQLARAGTASQVQRVVRAFRRCEQVALPEAVRQREGRYLSLRTDDDGMLVLEGRLPPVAGALLTRALEAAGQVLWSRSEDASAEAPAGAGGAGADASAEASAADVVDPGTAVQRRADALALLAETALAGLGRDGRGEPLQVVLHVDEEVLGGQRTDGGTCHLEHGPAVAAETARRLSCDAPMVRLTEDERGQPLDLGRKSRRVSAALWRALRTRDATCRFPGCATASRLTAHHVTHWAAGGPTSQDNVLLLCRRHHWAVHEGGFSVRGRAPDALTFYTPAGIPLSASPQPPRLAADPVAALRARHAEAGLELGPHSNVIWWQGERLDLDWTVEDLRLSCSKGLRLTGSEGSQRGSG